MRPVRSANPRAECKPELRYLEPKSLWLPSLTSGRSSSAFTGFSFLRIFFTRRFVFLKVVLYRMRGSVKSPALEAPSPTPVVPFYPFPAVSPPPPCLPSLLG